MFWALTLPSRHAKTRVACGRTGRNEEVRRRKYQFRRVLTISHNLAAPAAPRVSLWVPSCTAADLVVLRSRKRCSKLVAGDVTKSHWPHTYAVEVFLLFD